MPVEGLSYQRPTIARAAISIQLRADGSAEILETYTLTSERGFRHIYTNLIPPFQGQTEGYRFDVAQSLQGETPDQFTEIVLFNPESGTGRAPFSYELVSESKTRTRIKLTGMFEPGTWLFRSHYVINNAVLQTEDAAILRVLFFPGIPTAIARSSLEIKIPTAIAESDYDLIFINESPVNYTFNGERSWTATANNLASDYTKRLFLKLPADVFTNLMQSPDARTADEQLDTAHKTANNAKMRGQFQRNMLTIIPFTFGAGLLLFGIYYLYFEREGVLRHAHKEFALWPSRVPPASSALLLNQKKLAPLMLATLLRLTNRRTLTLEGFVFTWTNPEHIDYSRFTSFEVFLMHWFLGEITDGEYAASAIQVKQYAKSKQHEKAFAESMKQMKAELTRSFLSMRLFDERKSWYARLIVLIFGIAFFTSALLFAITLRAWQAYLLFIPAIAFIWSSRGIMHLTSEGLRHRSEARLYRDRLASLEQIFQSAAPSYSEIESVIIALPRAVAYGRLDAFFDSLLALPERRFLTLAQALLKIYDNQEPPLDYDRDKEMQRLKADMKKLRATLKTSLAILGEVTP